MRVIRADDYRHMSRIAANLVSAQILFKPDCVLGLPTGSSPEGIYDELMERYREEDLDFARVHTINLDEYVGLDRRHPQSIYTYMQENLFEGSNFNMDYVHIPNGMAEDPEVECRRYDNVIQTLGGIDLMLLGIGVNGHVGFNEPADHFSLGTHMVELTSSTRNANLRFFDSLDEVPTHAYTMGTRDIMWAKKVVMVANGKNKAKAVRDAFFGPVTPWVPASILQYHKDFTLVADCYALSMV